MTSNTSARYLDVLSDEAIRDAQDEHSWRRLFAPRVRAKAIPLGEIHTPNQTPAVSRTSSAVASIDSNRVLAVVSDQRPPNVQRLSESEREILDVIECLGGVASSQDIADDIGCSAKVLRRNELHRLHRDGVIEPVHARGYRLTELGRVLR